MRYVTRCYRLDATLEQQAIVRVNNPEINGVEYQQGTLLGYEVREYLLLKWGHRCAYRDRTGLPLQVEHIIPRARGGSDRISNLMLACEDRNDHKKDRPIQEVLAHDPERLGRILAQTTMPLRDAAAVNSTRWALCRALAATELPVEMGSGGRTK